MDNLELIVDTIFFTVIGELSQTMILFKQRNFLDVPNAQAK